MKAHAVYAANPFRPTEHRACRLVHRRLKVARLARELGVRPDAYPTMCFVNGQPLLRRHWRAKRLRDGDVVTFVGVVGKGGGGSSPLRIILMVAVAVLAAYTGGLAAGAYGPLVGSLVQGAVAVAGFLLINALLPPAQPPSSQQNADQAAASPTYSLAAQGNQARLRSAIPVWYGRHIIYPDFAAAPYYEFDGNEQLLYQLFCVGQGSFDVEALRIEDTDIDSFQDVSYELVEPGGTVTLFPTNVVTSVEVTGQEALTSTTLGPFTANPAGSPTQLLAVDIVCPKGLYYANNDGGLDAKTIAFLVEAREIDDNGDPVGGWTTLGTESFAGQTITPQRRTYRYAVTSGRYEVRFTRTDTKDTDPRAGHDLNWVGLRAYLPGSQAYGQVTMLAIRMRASNQLSGISSRRINLIATRKLAWRAAGQWTAAAATRSIAPVLADVCRNVLYGIGASESRYDLLGLERLHGVWEARGDTFDGGFDNTITAWEALTLVARAGRALPVMAGGRIYFVRDEPAELPQQIFSMRNIVRGSLKLQYALHTEESADGIEVEYLDATTWKPAIAQAYFAGESVTRWAKMQLFGVTGRTQAWREGMRALAETRYRRRFVSFQTELEGHLVGYGDLIAIQHDLPAWGEFGEVVDWDAGTLTATLSEPMTWTAGATHYAAFRTTAGAFSGPWVVTQGATAYELVLAEQPFDERGRAFTPYTGSAKERTQAIFGRADQHWLYARVTGVKPSGKVIEITAVNEDIRVHTADTGTPASLPAWALPPAPAIPEISGYLYVVAGGSVEKPTLAISWLPAAGADRYLVEHAADADTGTPVSITLTRTLGTATAEGTDHGFATGDTIVVEGADQADYNGTKVVTVTDDDHFTFFAGGAPASPATGTITAALVEPNWTRIAEVERTNLKFEVLPGQNYVRVAPVGRGQGPWVAWGGIVSPAEVAPVTPGAITGLVATGAFTTIILEWDALSITGVDHIDILRNDTNDSGGAQVIASVHPASLVYADAIGEIGATYYYWVRPVSKSGLDGSLSSGANATTGELDGDSFEDGSINGSKLGAGTVAADRLVAATITAASGVIDDLAIVNANIADAAVDTLQLAGQAVIIPGASSGSPGAGITNTVSSAVGTVTVDFGTYTPSRVLVMATLYVYFTTTGLFAAGPYFYGEILRDGSPIVQQIVGTGCETNAPQTQYYTIPLMIADSPTSGSHSYTVRAGSAGFTGTTTCYFSAYGLGVFGAKR